ncbi:MAG: glucoamylase family protein [Tissierellaceae bacterium]
MWPIIRDDKRNLDLSLYRTKKKANVRNFLINNLEASFKDIRRIYKILNRELVRGKKLPVGSQWILDNFYYIEQKYIDLKNSIRRDKRLVVHVVDDGIFKGYPRAYLLALDNISNINANITEDSLIEFINLIQKDEILTLEEIYHLPSFINLGLLQHIQNVLLDILDLYRKWEKVEALDILSESNLEDIIGNIHLMTSTEVERLRRRIKEEANSSKDILERIDEKLDYLGSSVSDLLEREYRRLSQFQIGLKYGITGLRTIYDLNWERIFENISLVEKAIEKDPLDVYRHMDRASKNLYRFRIQELADKFKVQEIYVAKKLVELAGKEFDRGNRDKGCHIGYYLLDEGLEKLYQEFNYRGSIGRATKMDQGLYILSLVGLSLVFSLLFSHLAYREGKLEAFILSLVAVTSISVNLINDILMKVHGPTTIPKIDFEDIPKEYSTFVIVPCLLPNPERIDQLAETLETHYLSNRDENIYFGILGDYKDGQEEKAQGDQEIVARGLAAVEELNRKYAGGLPRFYYFHRRRTLSKTQGRWMGWERKRGALIEFNSLLLDQDTTFEIVSNEVSELDIKYVITLDADTKLPINAAKKLIGSLAHPLNQAVLGDEGRTVESGYGIIQPRIVVDGETGNRSFFSRVFAAEGGIDSYSGAISDIYQDLFCQAIFTGKGIYDLRTFQHILKDTIPENSVLSHDLLEGSYLRTGLATDIFLMDGFPDKYDSYIMRQHRWVRGDWQLIKWLYGSRGRDMSLLSKWKIADNMRRSLLPLSLLMLMLSTAIYPIRMSIWAAFVFPMFFYPLLAMAVKNILVRDSGRQGIRLHGNQIRGYRLPLYRGLLSLIFLPYEGVKMLDAISRSLYRVFISKRNLLEWTTSFELENRSGHRLSAYFKRMRANIIIGLLFIGSSYLLRGENAAIILPLSSFWLLGPLVAFYISREDREETVAVKKEDIELLRSIGQKTWDFYREITDEKNNYLPPDNFQEYPYNGSANRTSPTNIGFYLLSILSSCDLGYIDADQMIDLVDRTITSLEKLDKWEGNLYNWYDTESLQALRPIFVSTVDSGNLLAYLIVLREGLGEYMGSPESDEKNLLRRIDSLIDNTKLKPLYNAEKQLFHIGYDLEGEKKLAIYYDLLASEARTSSYIAISRGEIGPEHWHRLDKPLVKEGGYISLASWSGTMFEYLMPALNMKNFKNTLLDESYRSSVDIQRNYGHIKGVPWGISESAYFAFDSDFNYQYKAFGVAKLGFKRGLKDELVISPYSTFLALSVDYPRAMNNIRRMISEGFEGKYGFYESIDYTKKRLPKHLEMGIVKSYMSHHQGMILTAINNFLNDNITVKRFHKNPSMKCGEYLLQEKVPQKFHLSNEYENPNEFAFYKDNDILWNNRQYGMEALEDIKCHILSSASYSTMINSFGEGFSKNRDIFINRWRKDFLAKPYGQFIYLKDLKNNRIWSTSFAPTFVLPDSYSVSFSTDKASFTRRDGKIESLMEIFLLPGDLGEMRKIRLKNLGSEEALLEVISYFELTGTSYQADLAHMAFSNLFVKTELLENREGLVAHRRKREGESDSSIIFHGLKVFGQEDNIMTYETNRSNFIGRGNSLRKPQALEKGNSNTVGIVLDPIMSIGKKLSIGPGESVEIYYITGISTSKEEVVDILNKYDSRENINMAMDLISSKSQTEIGYLNLDHANIELYEELLPYIFYLKGNKNKYKGILARKGRGKEGLWAHGISGDNPIVLVRIGSLENLDNLIKVLHAHEYWTYKGLTVDLIVVYEEEDKYYRPLNQKILELIYEIRGNLLNVQGGIYPRNIGSLDQDDISLFYKRAALIINAQEGFTFDDSKIYGQVKGGPRIKTPAEPIRSRELELDFFNGYGGFSKNGEEYVIRLQKGLNTPMPWVNVVANEEFGFIISERGTGFTWSVNSRENKLTPWYNDLINDLPSEIVYIRDRDSNELFSITPEPIRGEEDYIISYGKGYVNFEHNSHDLEQELTIFVPREEKVKINLIKLKNTADRERKLKIYYYIRPVIGVTDEETQLFLESSMDQGEIFTVENTSNSEFEGSSIFISSSKKINSYTGDRLEFLGYIPDYENPRGARLEKLSNRVGAGYNPCGVLELELCIPPGGQEDIVFLLAEERDGEKGRETVNKYRDLDSVTTALREVKDFWDRTVKTIEVSTKDKALNYLMNSWLIYQTISSRLWARAGYYQVGGAFGARDQIQDVSNILYHRPGEARRQILENCAHQYLEGDIQHWWHPAYDNEVNKGIRSRCSDDMLWLPYCLAKYIEATEDYGILDEEVNYIESDKLREGEYERYELPRRSAEKSTVYEHCIRAIRRGINLSERNIPLIGTGDWNDGMGKVGYKGKGESIWLGWFLGAVLQAFIPICRIRNDLEQVKEFEDLIPKLREAVEEGGWDGEWYMRAFFDDGSPIGSKHSEECIIDSISQSWSVISGLGREDRIRPALSAAEKHLVNEEDGIIALLSPPFENTELNPGYIKSYVAGVRENGGQYTHAAAWLIKAFALLGEGDKAYNLFKLINPINHTRTQIECARYKVEPYVLAADVYTNPQHLGRGGWTWYTGSSGWIYSVVLEDILGFRKEGKRIFINPSIPKDWDQYSIKYRYGKSTYHIEVKNSKDPDEAGYQVLVNGRPLEGDYIELTD